MPLNHVLYMIKISLNYNDISIFCEPKNEYEKVLSSFTYSFNLDFNEFKEKGKCFRSCDDITEIYNILEIILQKEIKYNDMLSKKRLEILNDDKDSICLILEIPLITGKYETINFKFEKEEKDIKSHNAELKEYIKNVMENMKKIIK